MKSYDIDLEDAMERWKHKLYEIFTRRCACITCTLHWIEAEVHDPLKYDGLTYIYSFLKYFEL